ncbi:Serpentine Receptor, class T [Caenorhabditis elegans]|uniref:Serpentine Receptor, class T n=1 Tax=Caenorhabditis elegans TaxID=6239 RepID=Q9NAN9_CAEEL|nr:Serpentine Receptor, class T [Caenorhabditis elegans]CAB70255.1 Serpentine Receptor, class T [Caenorhabditis elegans]|eukprot:NP_502823.1 Serpentine Receptor, class T [Caenorhabditis elegans]
MNRLIQYGNTDSIPFYNCSWKPQSEWWSNGVQRPWLGYPITVFGIFIELLYIPIINIIFKTKLIKHTCYKIIVLLAVTDMCATACSCIITGILLIQGAVFCVYPTFIYITGGIALCNWCGACAITVSLFLNRIVSIGLREYADKIEKPMAYISMVFCVIYMFYISFFTTPACFNSLIMAWPSDPLSEKEPSEEATNYYRNASQAWNNWIFITCMVVLFTLYYALVKKLARGQSSKASRAIFIQCCIICFFNSCTAIFYNSLAFITPSPAILVFGQLCWSINHGCPALIYVTMNETIRREFKKLIFRVATSKVEEGTSSANVKTITQSRI